MRSTPLLLVAAVLVALPARAEPAPPVTTIVTPNFTFLPGSDRYPVPLQVLEGGIVTHVNLDPQAVIANTWGIHGIVSAGESAPGVPLFRGERVGFGGVAIVEGVEQLPAGLYPFKCATHPDIMTGLLEVLAL